jgi:hypothetical protein
MSDEWEKIDTEIWLPEEAGDEVVGEIVKVETGLYGQSYTLKPVKGKEVRLPSHKVLQGRLAGCAKGDFVKIVFKGEEAPKVKGQNPMKMYDVFRKK